jgi:hypothetical protein
MRVFGLVPAETAYASGWYVASFHCGTISELDFELHKLPQAEAIRRHIGEFALNLAREQDVSQSQASSYKYFTPESVAAWILRWEAPGMPTAKLSHFRRAMPRTAYYVNSDGSLTKQTQ